MLSSFVVLQRKKSQILVYIENKHHGVGEVSELRGFQYISLRKHHNNDEQTLEMSLTMIPIYQYTYEGLIFTVMGIEISSRYYFGGWCRHLFHNTLQSQLVKAMYITTPKLSASARICWIYLDLQAALLQLQHPLPLWSLLNQQSRAKLLWCCSLQVMVNSSRRLQTDLYLFTSRLCKPWLISESAWRQIFKTLIPCTSPPRILLVFTTTSISTSTQLLALNDNISTHTCSLTKQPSTFNQSTTNRYHAFGRRQLQGM